MKSPSVFADYYKQHDKFEADQKHGYQTVGDIAYRDDEGYVYICDRKKDMIISGGMNIYPAEIEAALEAHPDVLEAAVFGIPSEEWGETVHAVVVVREGATMTEDDVHAFAREHLASYKVPRSVTWMRRAAEDRQRQDPEARAARPVLGRPRPARSEPHGRASTSARSPRACRARPMSSAADVCARSRRLRAAVRSRTTWRRRAWKRGASVRGDGGATGGTTGGLRARERSARVHRSEAVRPAQ